MPGCLAASADSSFGFDPKRFSDVDEDCTVCIGGLDVENAVALLAARRTVAIVASLVIVVALLEQKGVPIDCGSVA